MDRVAHRLNIDKNAGEATMTVGDRSQNVSVREYGFMDAGSGSVARPKGSHASMSSGCHFQVPQRVLCQVTRRLSVQHHARETRMFTDSQVTDSELAVWSADPEGV